MLRLPAVPKLYPRLNRERATLTSSTTSGSGDGIRFSFPGLRGPCDFLNRTYNPSPHCGCGYHNDSCDNKGETKGPGVLDDLTGEPGGDDTGVIADSVLHARPAPSHHGTSERLRDGPMVGGVDTEGNAGDEETEQRFGFILNETYGKCG